MCGIAGCIGLHETIVKQMLRRISHRGPDNSSYEKMFNDKLVLGHNRLSILDICERGNQPLWSMDGRYCIVFNGEIYNYIELKRELEKKGVIFRTETDTEVLLYWLINNGESGVKDLDGMYSFALADLLKGTLLCARDPFGEKPFYYSYNKKEGFFAFCSEIKGLLEVPNVGSDINPIAISDYLTFLYVPAPNTFYSEINELHPGGVLKIDINTLGVKKDIYNILESRINGYIGQGEEEGNEYYDGFRERFKASVARRLRSDVPISILLSGGIDSNSILSMALRDNEAAKISAFTIKYNGSKGGGKSDESGIAIKIAKSYGIPIKVSQFDLSVSLVDLADHVLGIFDQPFGNATAIVSDCIYSELKSDFKVALVGDGGDEVAVGYPRYKALPVCQRVSKCPPYLRRVISSLGSKIVSYFLGDDVKRRGRKLFEGLALDPAECFLAWSTYTPRHLLPFITSQSNTSGFYEFLLDAFNREYDRDIYRAASIVDFYSFVPYNLMQCADRTSMFNGVEVRSPFLNLDLVAYSLSVPPSLKVKKGRTKPLITLSMKNDLPECLASLPKKGFNPPVHSLLVNNLDVLKEVLCSKSSCYSSYLSQDWVLNELRDFERGVKENSTLVWGLFLFERWLQNKRGGY